MGVVSVYDPVPDMGYLYDHVPLYNERRDVAFYLDEARRASGPVLEIGCGTGRILLPIARDGIAITGLDGSRLMVERLRRRLMDESAEVRSRVTVVEGDGRHFDIGGKFALITAPFRVFQHMVQHADQVGFLQSVARHLAPGGRFVFDVFNPRFDLLVKDRREITIDTPELEMPDGRRLSRGSRIMNVRWVDQVSEVELHWYLTNRDGGKQEFVQPFEMRWYTPSEIEHLAARCGFRVEAAYGTMERGPLVDGAPEQLWVLSRA